MIMIRLTGPFAWPSDFVIQKVETVLAHPSFSAFKLGGKRLN